MKNTGRGETSNIEQSEVDEPVNISSKNDANKLNNMQNGQKLKVRFANTPLYNAPIGGYFSPMNKEGTLEQIKLEKGEIVTYSGKYETSENPLNNSVTVYVLIKLDDGTEGYVKITTIQPITEKTSSSKVHTEKSSIANINNVTSRAGEELKYIGEEGENYVVAIAAGRNNEDDKGITNEEKELVEEELTIKVAEKVEKMLGEYSNIEVIQTGSTTQNPSSIEPEDRAKKASDANPNLCIQIYFGDGDNAGVETIYKQGDEISKQLAEILTDNLSSTMGLTNLKAGTDNEKCKDSEGNSASLSIIQNAASTGFPSVVAIGGNLNKDPDASVIANDGINKYAQAIVKSIDEYFKADHSGRISTEQEESNYKDSVESKIINMKYVTQEKLDGYVEKGDFDNAIKSYSLDDSGNIIIASWSQDKDGKITLKTNNAISLKTALSKYAMPYEYLMYFYIDSDDKNFVNDLADEVLKSEIVIAVEDNVTTVDTTENTEQRNDANIDKFDTDWTQVKSINYQTENVSTTTNLTYVNTWCVKTYQQNSYSEAVMQLGDANEKIVTVPGRVTESNSASKSGDSVVEGSPFIGKYTETEMNKDGEMVQVEKQYKYNVLEHIITKTHTISNSYEKGDYKTEGRENVFVELYNKYDMISKVRTTDYLFKIIEDNEKTANLLDLTKYLIYKATHINWGVLEFDYEGEYSLSSLSSMTGIYGGTIQEKVWFALRDLGYSETAVAGAMGNIDYESGGFNPSIVESGAGEGIGLIQWSFGRRTQLENYAKSKGLTWQDEDTQVEFLVTEISGKGAAVGYANQRKSGYIIQEHIVSTCDDWANSTSIEDATLYFMRFFESPKSKASYSERVSRANKYYSEFKGKTKPSADARVGTIKLSGENASKMAQLLNEAIRIADDDRYTYSQANRYGEFQYDCSSLVSRLYSKFFGISAPSNTREYGSQYYIGNPDSIELQPGDIVWKPGHVEIYIGNGMTVGAHTDECAGPDQISVVNYPKGYYTKAYRFITN